MRDIPMIGLSDESFETLFPQDADNAMHPPHML